MKQTVADLMGPRGYSVDSPQQDFAISSAGKMQGSDIERVFTISIVQDPNEVEILDRKVVIEKRVVARNRWEALDKCGFIVRD